MRPPGGNRLKAQLQASRSPAVPFRHGLSFPNESEENCCNFSKICYRRSPYGYSKEKCILSSCSRSGN